MYDEIDWQWNSKSTCKGYTSYTLHISIIHISQLDLMFTEGDAVTMK